MLGTPFSPDILIDFYKPKTIPKDPQNVFSEKSQMMRSLWSVLMMRIHVLMMFWSWLMMIHKVCRKWQHDIVDSLQYQEFQDYRISVFFTLEHENVLVIDHLIRSHTIWINSIWRSRPLFCCWWGKPAEWIKTCRLYIKLCMFPSSTWLLCTTKYTLKYCGT